MEHSGHNIITYGSILPNVKKIKEELNIFQNTIDKLKSESAYLNGLELTTSKIKKDLNELNYKNYKNDNSKNTFILEMRNINELKQTIKSLFPKVIVRTYNPESGFNAHLDVFSSLMIINENLFEKNNFENMIGANNDSKSFEKLDKVIKGLIDLDIKENNELYNLYIYKAFWRINHECFGHLPVLEINNKKCDTPKKFFSKGIYIKSNDAGKILEYFFHNDEDEIADIKNINCNVISLLKDELFVGKDFSLLWKKFRELEKNNNKKGMEINLSPEEKFMVEMLNEYDGIVNLKGEKRKIMKEKTIKRKFHLKRRFKS